MKRTEELIRFLNSDDEEERLYVLQDMTDTPEMIPHLMERLRIEHSQIVKESIVSLLKTMDYSDHYDLLFQLFYSHDSFIRNAGITIFGSDGEQALNYLSAKLQHTDRVVKKIVLDGVALINSPYSRKVLRSCLFDESPNVRAAVIEHLTTLEDVESIEEMMKLLELEREPMVVLSLLDSLIRIGSNEEMRKALSILKPEKKSYDELIPYFSQVLQLVAMSGSKEDLLSMIEAKGIEDISIYSESLISSLGAAKRRYGSSLIDCTIRAKLVMIIEDSSVRPEIRFMATEYLLDSPLDREGSRLFYNLGHRLINERGTMLYSGIKLISKSGAPGARREIEAIESTTHDEAVSELCREILMGANNCHCPLAGRN